MRTIDRDSMQKTIFRWAVTLAYAAGIFYLSVMPGGGPKFFPHQDKVMHFVMYAGLAFLFIWALRVTRLRPSSSVPLLAAIIAIAYGALNEINQFFIPYRSAEAADIAANVLGAAAGAYAGARVARMLEARRGRGEQGGGAG